MAIDLDPTVLRAALEPLPDPSAPEPPKGEPPKDSSPKRRGIKRESGLVATARPEQSIPEAYAELEREVCRYLAEPQPYVQILAAPPGLGKTHLLVKLAEREAMRARRVLYLGPQHRFLEDILGIASRPGLWQEWLPRQEGAEDKPETCRYAPQMDRWIHRGYDAMKFCQKQRVCGWDYINEKCPWHAQKKQRSPIVFGQHAHLCGIPDLDTFDLVIGDECPLGAMMHHWVIPPKHITNAGMPLEEPMQELLNDLEGLVQRERMVDGKDLLTLLGGPAHVLGACAQIYDVPDIDPNLRSVYDVDAAPYFHAVPLARLLYREASAALAGRDYPPRVAVSKGGLHLLLRRYLDKRLLETPIIWADATAHQGIYNALFDPRSVEIIAPSVAHQGRIFQVWQRANGKGSLLKEEQPTEKAAQLKSQVDHILKRGQYQKPKSVTFKGLVDYFGIDSVNFSAVGTNRLEDCDCLIVAGTPQPALEDIHRDARMLFHDRMEPFHTEWSTRDLVYRVHADGSGESYPVSGYWHDDDLSAMLWQQREAKLIQAAHRARPLRKQADIWLLTNIPLPSLEPDALLTIGDVFEAPKGIDPYRWPSILAYAEQQESEAGYVTTADLVREFDLSKPTADKYINLIAEHFGWPMFQATGRGRGRPPKATGKGDAQGVQIPNK